MLACFRSRREQVPFQIIPSYSISQLEYADNNAILYMMSIYHFLIYYFIKIKTTLKYEIIQCNTASNAKMHGPSTLATTYKYQQEYQRKSRLVNRYYNAHFNFMTNNKTLTYTKQRVNVQRIFSTRMINIYDGSTILQPKQ